MTDHAPKRCLLDQEVAPPRLSPVCVCGRRMSEHEHPELSFVLNGRVHASECWNAMQAQRRQERKVSGWLAPVVCLVGVMVLAVGLVAWRVL